MQERGILGVDISKAKFDVALRIGDRLYSKVFPNTGSGYKSCLSWCYGYGVKALRVCLEATSWYGEGLSEYLYKQGCEVSVVNPARIKAYGRSKGVRHKTDKADARIIAEFCEFQDPSLWHPISEGMRQLRDLYRCLQGLKEEQRKAHNRLENEKSSVIVQEHWQRIVDYFKKQIESVEILIQGLIKEDASLKQKIDHLTMIKGICWLSALSVLVEMPDVKDFKDARQFVAYAGLSPRRYESGSSVRANKGICKAGSVRVRTALYMPAIVAKNHNDVFKAFAQRLASRGKSGKVIVVAIMRKLLHIFFGMLKHNTPFNPDLAFKPQ